MTFEQGFLLSLLGVVLALFAWGRFRYDIVAFAALLMATLAGTVPPGDMFSGFAHPATVTVALVLIVSRGLSNSGAIDAVARAIPALGSPVRHVATLAGVGAALSSFMNNVGALALMMPATLQTAAKAKRSPALLLMPLSYGTILGGLLTLIGTPPNIIVATFRGRLTGNAFTMFDFTPVGGVVAVAGVVFVATVGWRLVPQSRRAKLTPRDLFEIDAYLSEVVVEEGSALAGQSLNDVDDRVRKHDALVVGLFRKDRRIDHEHRREVVEPGDVLVLETSPETLAALLRRFELHPADSVKKRRKRATAPATDSGEIVLTEAVVTPGARIIGQTPATLRLRRRYGVNLLAVSRQGRPFRGRLRAFTFRAGDVLLLEGDPEKLPAIIGSLGGLPLAARGFTLRRRRIAPLSLGIFTMAVLAATFGVLSLPVALAAAVGMMALLNIVPPREVYDAVDWPVVVLLGAMIPIGAALEQTGATAVLASGLLAFAPGSSPVTMLTLVLIVAMTLSDVMNNAATAVVMAPVSVTIAEQMDVHADPFLMAVAVGASCAFLTPIGHQNNTLILGPGGYRFGDYWRMGLPLELVIVVVSIPMILWVWPL